MLNLRNEWMKLIRKRSAIILMILSALFPLVVGPGIQALQNKFSFTAFDGESFPLVILSLAVSFYLPLLLALAVSDMFSGEQEQKTLAFILVRPISRLKVYSSKVAATGIYLLILLLIVCTTSLLTGAIWLENFTFQGLLIAIAAFLLSWFPLMAIGLLIIFFVQWFGSSSRALTFSILLYLVMMAVTYLFPTIARWLPAYDSDWYQRWINTGMSSILAGRALYLLSWSALLFTLGYYKFSKKEY
ncbi:MAG: ABC transporter permease subunit [Bacillota bacterium]|nr:ABC transporter permease subunit [Bacillota bacterium]MDP4170776.1 ABC transporter permease subunit [Bacillota bacterium]